MHNKSVINAAQGYREAAWRQFVPSCILRMRDTSLEAYLSDEISIEIDDTIKIDYSPATRSA